MNSGSHNQCLKRSSKCALLQSEQTTVWRWRNSGVTNGGFTSFCNRRNLDVTRENQLLIVDSDTNLVLITDPDISKVEERIGRHRQLVSPTRVAVNTNNELYILHNRGRAIDVFNLKDESLKCFHLQHQSFESEHIRYNPDLLVTDKYLTLTFDNLIFVYNFDSGVFSQAILDGTSGVIPKCIVTTNEEMLALKHDIIIRYKMDYFD